MRPRCTKRKGFWLGSGPKWNQLAVRQHLRLTRFMIVKSIAYVNSRPSPSLRAVLVCQNSQLRDGATNQKSTLNEVFSKAIRKPVRKPVRNTNGNNAPLAVRDGA